MFPGQLLSLSFTKAYFMCCIALAFCFWGCIFLIVWYNNFLVMWPTAFVLEFFIVDNLAHKLAFRIVTQKDRPIAITIAISVMIICIMCPTMSLIATILFKKAGSQFVAVWLQTTFMNFPVAFFWQLMYCGPLIRFIFTKVFLENKTHF